MFLCNEFSKYATNVRMKILCLALTTIFLMVSFPVSLRTAFAEEVFWREGKMPISRTQILKVTDQGFSKKQLHMKAEDISIFFLNDTSNSNLSIKIEYGSKVMHCATKNLTIDPLGNVHSNKPFAPQDFVSVCFHDRGSYPITVYGLKSAPKGLQGEIIVD
jgi:hypothetical protein